MTYMMFVAAGVAVLVLLLMIIIGKLRSELQHLKSLVSEELQISRRESISTLTNLASLTQNRLDEVSRQTGTLSERTERQLLAMRDALDTRLESIRRDNEQKLEQMRLTVDEKLHETLERRLGESFQLVNEQLHVVSKGLGEMQVLADGVGDLKRVLTNVKSRGMIGEFQLQAILQEILAPDQYAVNVATKQGSSDRVEFAVRLPGPQDRSDGTSGVWLPIDAKFPKEDYERLVQAQQAGNAELAEQERKALRVRLRSEAKDIASKYIDPPGTTDFAVLFLPFEGLYAEVLNTTGLTDELQRSHRVIVAGPTTLTALLNSLQMGFRTLAIQKRSSEVWQILGGVKTEFSRFGELLDKTRKRLNQASGDLDRAYRSTERIHRKLVSVESTSHDMSREIEEDTV
jgi:DNA recombination protein RmuC